MEKERFLVNVSGVNWQCFPAMEMQLEHLPSFMNLNWESSMEQGTNQFDSAYTSVVSSPAASTVVNTPASSPPKLNLAMVEQQMVGRRSHPTPANSLVPFPTDPGFAERAAKNSCFGNQSLGGAMELPYISASAMAENSNGREESSVSDQVITEVQGRKRKAAPKGKTKDSAKVQLGALLKLFLVELVKGY